MFTLKGRQDGFRLTLPVELIPDQVSDKYAALLIDARSFITKPIDLINESIQKVEVFGFQGGTVAQQQTMHGNPIMTPSRTEENRFQGGASDVIYRSPATPVSLVDKTLNIDFRHGLGYMTYMILLETFYWQYSRDMKNLELPQQFTVDLFSERGARYSRLLLMKPVMDSMDMLSLDYSQPIAASQTFRVVWKYSNFDYQFIDTTDDEDELVIS